MNSSDSDISWPTTTSQERSLFCCFPVRRAPKHVKPPKAEREAEKRKTESGTTGSKTKDAGKLITLFNPDVPMTPNVARTESTFVVDGFFFDSVRANAYVSVRDGNADIPCSTVLNEGFVPSGQQKRLMYIGFRYPDGTSLSYVPIRDVILQHRVSAMSSPSSFEKGNVGAVYGKDYVYMCLPRVVYYTLVQMAETVFKQRNGDMECCLPEVDVRDERVWLFNTEMMESCKVEWYSNGRRIAKPVAQGMKEMDGNLEGDALVFMRFCEDGCGDDPEMKLQFRLHRMMVKSVSRY